MEKDIKPDEQKHIIHIRQEIRELDKKLLELQVTRENNLMELQDEIIDNKEKDNIKKVKTLLKYTTKNSELNIIIENRKLLKMIESNMDAIGQTYLGSIPD